MRRFVLVLLALTACGGADKAGLLSDADAGVGSPVEQQPVSGLDGGTTPLTAAQGACASGKTCGFEWRFYGGRNYCLECRMAWAGFPELLACDAEGNLCDEGNDCASGSCASTIEWRPCWWPYGTLSQDGSKCITGPEMGTIESYTLDCECRVATAEGW